MGAFMSMERSSCAPLPQANNGTGGPVTPLNDKNEQNVSKVIKNIKSKNLLNHSLNALQSKNNEQKNITNMKIQDIMKALIEYDLSREVAAEYLETMVDEKLISDKERERILDDYSKHLLQKNTKITGSRLLLPRRTRQPITFLPWQELR